jgi:DNA-nicking Smr family endonuclease
MADDDITNEDKHLFREAMKTVTPLKMTAKLPRHKTKPPPQKRPVIGNQPPIQLHYALSSHCTEEVGSNTILSFCVPGLSKKRLLALKRGEIPWEARLDMHGLVLDQAQGQLCDFIQRQYTLGQRCLLVIHGKGSPNGLAPVLKNHVNHWLKQLPQVLAFHSALPKDGGAGALYVLLRRILV